MLDGAREMFEVVRIYFNTSSEEVRYKFCRLLINYLNKSENRKLLGEHRK